MEIEKYEKQKVVEALTFLLSNTKNKSSGKQAGDKTNQTALQDGHKFEDIVSYQLEASVEYGNYNLRILCKSGRSSKAYSISVLEKDLPLWMSVFISVKSISGASSFSFGEIKKEEEIF